ncbi:hypothetical protein DH2020_021338 [Rehmannia glutinosa]|uniref:Rad51-like C-terminal domain-containing protein n=1 Tax=Rehmannia glutinosa TaxID=99300 RepID=A0ABR0WA46_REHGL
MVSKIESQRRPWLNGLELLEDSQINKGTLSTGCERYPLCCYIIMSYNVHNQRDDDCLWTRIDVLLQGGLREGHVTELVGPSSSGKTQICLKAASNVSRKYSGTVMYFDTGNSFSAKRIAQFLSQSSDPADIEVTNHMVAGEAGISKPALGESWKSIPHVRLLLSRYNAINEFSQLISMISSRFKPTRTLTEFHRLIQLNRCIQANHIHGDLHNKRTKKPRPHKLTRNQLRTPIPFLNNLKQCKNPEEFLSIFYDFYEMGYKHDYPSFASLTYKLARARKFDDIEVVLDFLESHDIRCGEALFIGLIRHYGKARMIDKAVEVFHEMGKSFNCVRTVQSFNTILNVLVDNDRISDAIELFEKGPKMRFRLNSVSFNIMIKLWLKKGEWEKAREVFDEMLEREVEPTAVTYNSQIGFLCKRGQVDEAIKFFDDMRTKGKRGNAVTYALLMEGLCASGRFKEAKKMMFDMEYHGCKAQLVNYGVLMTDLAKNGLIDEAKGLLVEMKKRRIKPDVVMYNILIDYFCKAGAASDAYKVLVDMQVKGCEPNAATYRTVVDGFCRIEDFMGGLKVLNAMLNSNHFPRTETFRFLGIGLFRSGKIDEACFVLEEMKRRKMSLDRDSWEIIVREVCMDDGFVTDRLADIICSS